MCLCVRVHVVWQLKCHRYAWVESTHISKYKKQQQSRYTYMRMNKLREKRERER